MFLLTATRIKLDFDARADLTFKDRLEKNLQQDGLKGSSFNQGGLLVKRVLFYIRDLCTETMACTCIVILPYLTYALKLCDVLLLLFYPT